MTTLDMSDLGQSLLALSVAPRDERNLPMVTPGFCKRSVSCGGLINRIWELNFRTIDFFRPSAESVKQKCLLETLIQSQQSFTVQIPKVIKAYEDYTKYLKDLNSGNEVKPYQLAHARWVLSEWNAEMRAPKGESLAEMIHKANDSYAALMGPIVAKGKKIAVDTHNLLQYQAIFEQIARLQRIIDFEVDTESPIPFVLLRKLCEPGCELDVVEADTLKQWIDRLNNSPAITLRQMHHAFYSIVDYMAIQDPKEKGRPSALAFLECHLRRAGLETLNRPDPKYLEWRCRVEEAQKVAMGGRQYALENRLGGSSVSDFSDRHLIFPIRGDATSVMVFGSNEALVGMEVADAWERNSPVPLAEMKAMDPLGRCVLMERLAVPLSKYKWKSRKDTLAAADKPAVDALTMLLETLGYEELTPLISVQDLMFSQSGTLKLMRKAKVGTRYDFDRLVRLAFDASNRNLIVFRHLLRASGLANHDVVNYYREVVDDALAGTKSVGADKVARRRELADPYVRSRARKLSKDVRNLFDSCYAELTLRYKVPQGISRECVEQQIGKQILEKYQDSVGAGLLWPDLDESVIGAAAKALSLR